MGAMGSKEDHMENLFCENDNKIISNYLMFFSKNAYELMKEVFFVLAASQLAGQKKNWKNLIASRQMVQNSVYYCQL